MKYIAHPYQDHATEHIIDNDACGLFLEMGLGKTVSTLTAIDYLMHDALEINRVLVIAPKRVAEDTWTTEAAKWDHLRHLTISKVLGTEAERKQALKSKANIYVINRENVAWLISLYGLKFPFDMVVIDELSSFKSPKAVRFKALRKIRPMIKRVVGLTGTPAPNSMMDIWAPLYLLDQGERIEKTITAFRIKYFDRVPVEDSRRFIYVPYNLPRIYEKIGDICISMKAEDYLTLPEKIINNVRVKLPADVMQKYLEFEEEAVLELDNGEEISAVNAVALTTKLLQYANGAVYDADRNYHEVHTEKLEALEEIIEAANGKPVLVGYWYKHDFERLMKHFKKYNPVELRSSDNIKRWNEGKVRLMLAHPASAGHGLNLQAGGNIIVWFSQTWSLELYQQFNARLHRQGQQNAVIIHRLITVGTMDEDVIKAIANKDTGQNALIDAVKAKIEKYKTVSA